MTSDFADSNKDCETISCSLSDFSSEVSILLQLMQVRLDREGVLATAGSTLLSSTL